MGLLAHSFPLTHFLATSLQFPMLVLALLPDLQMLEGFKVSMRPPSLFSLHVRERIQLQLPYRGCGLPTASAAQASPLSSRPLDRYSWAPSRPHKWSRSQHVFDSVFPSHTGARAHTHDHFFLWISPFHQKHYYCPSRYWCQYAGAIFASSLTSPIRPSSTKFCVC